MSIEIYISDCYNLSRCIYVVREENMGHERTNSGTNLKRLWGIPAVQVRYHKDGTWFMPVDHFPAAFCDPNGYVLFKTKEEYENSSFLTIGVRVNVHNGIYMIPGYTKKKHV
jgi:hypothetical protein